MVAGAAVVALVAGLALAGAPAPAAPTPAAPAEARARLADLEREVGRLRAIEARYGQQRRGLLAELESLQNEAAIAQAELRVTEARLAAGETEAVVLSQRLETLEAQLGRDRERARQALRGAYERHQSDWWLAALGAEGPQQLARSVRLIGLLGNRQQEALAALSAQARQTSDARAALAAHLAQLRSLRAELAERRAAAERARAGREAFLRQVDNRRDEVMADLKRAQRDLGALVGGLGTAAAPPSPTGFAQSRGRMPWPADGTVSKRFGVESHPRFHTRIDHPGIDLAVAAGTPVRAVHAGRVAYSDWFRGYGLLVIVDHGDGYYTLYARLRETALGRGAVVSAGTLLGYAGEAGPLGEPPLYFEVRHSDQALDPAAWLAPRDGPARPRRRR